MKKKLKRDYKIESFESFHKWLEVQKGISEILVTPQQLFQYHSLFNSPDPNIDPLSRRYTFEGIPLILDSQRICRMGKYKKRDIEFFGKRYFIVYQSYYHDGRKHDQETKQFKTLFSLICYLTKLAFTLG